MRNDDATGKEMKIVWEIVYEILVFVWPLEGTMQ
jgi:hypothetical protein